MEYLATTFSPAMLRPGRAAQVIELTLDELREGLASNDWQSAVGHEVTAAVLSALLGCHVPFARINVSLDEGDALWCVIPSFRAAEAREFTRQEVEAAGYRCFVVAVGEDRWD